MSEAKPRDSDDGFAYTSLRREKVRAPARTPRITDADWSDFEDETSIGKPDYRNFARVRRSASQARSSAGRDTSAGGSVA